MRKFIMLFIFLSCLTSCENREFVVLIEQPTDKRLDNVNLKLELNNTETFSTKLKYSDIVPDFVTNEFLVNKNDIHNLKVILLDKEFNYKLSYPKDKYIIISPYYKNNDLEMGIKKNNEKYNLH